MKHYQFLCLLLFLTSSCQIDRSLNSAQWRGPNRDGIYPGNNLLKIWPVPGPELLWLSEEIGNGYGSPAVTREKLLVNGEIDSISHVFAFDLKGKLMWKSPNGREFFGTGFSASFPGARSTPTVSGDLVYVCSGLGRIACMETATGKEKWSVDMVSNLGGKLNMFGYAESLMVDEKNVYCFPGGSRINIAALDKFTGKIVWTSKALGDSVSFCSPVIINLPERKILATISHEYLMGLDIINGELLWSYKEDSVKLEGEYCNTPVYADGFIYGISGVEKGKGAYKLKLSSDGKKISEVWINRNVKNGMGGFVKSGDLIFSTTDDKKLKCLDTVKGVVNDSLPNLRGSIIFADNQLYCYSDNGNMNLIKPAGTKMEVVSKFKIEKGTKEHFSHPVIGNGVLYIRHGKALMAYAIK
jgi:outer membrane protein assembly factor BamB